MSEYGAIWVRFVRHRWWVGALIAVVFLLAVAPRDAAAQATSASIIGRVADESGALLPGVTVTASSPALQLKQVTAVTDKNGEYRITQLPLGAYEVTYELAGFQTLKREGVRLEANFVAKLDIVMKVGQVTESVTVVGGAPVVDVTSTSTRTEFRKEELELIPSSRNSIVNLLNQAPGINGRMDVGGNNAGVLPSMPVFGRPGQSEPMLEGINGREATGNLGGSYYDASIFEEAQVETVGHNAESAVSGVRLNAISKSGSNVFHGTIYGAYENPRFQANNLDAAMAAQGVTWGNPIKYRWDTSGDLGGRIIQDKLWFYGAVRRQKNESGVVGLTGPDGVSAGFDPSQITYLTGKLSYQPTRDHRFVLFDSYFKKDVLGGGSQFVPWYSQWHNMQPGANYKAQWTGTFGANIVADAQFGGSYYTANMQPLSTDLATYDIVTQKYTGQQVNQYPTPRVHDIWRNELKASLTAFKKDWFHGDHELKFGGNYYREGRSEAIYHREAGDYMLRFNNGAAYQIQTFNTPVVPWNAVAYTGAFLQDKWAVNNRLTFNIGLRYDRYNMYLPEQTRAQGEFASAQTFPRIQFAIWNEIVPRLHFAYDLSGNGKTVIKGGWGRFGVLRDAYYEPDPYQNNQFIQTTWKWHDLNGDKLYQPGEVNLDPNAPDWVSVSSGGKTAIVNTNEQQPKLDEFTFAIERELVQNVSLRATALYARDGNNRRLLNTMIPYSAYNIPVTSVDPGPDGKVGTADDPGKTLTYWEYSTALQGLQYQIPTVVNDSNYVNSWTAGEIALTKRLSHNWQFRAAVSLTKFNMLFPETGEQRSIVALNPNAEINQANNTLEYLFKASGSYLLPFDILTSANYQLISGRPWARQVLMTGGKTIPTFTINAEPFGTQRLPTTHVVDLRLEKTFRLYSSHRVGLRADVFNIFNVNTPQGINARSGPAYGTPTASGSITAIVPPRIVNFAVTYSF